jgi:hypothetical protein
MKKMKKEVLRARRTAALLRRSARLSAETLVARAQSDLSRKRTMLLRNQARREDNSPATIWLQLRRASTD